MQYEKLGFSTNYTLGTDLLKPQKSQAVSKVSSRSKSHKPRLFDRRIILFKDLMAWNF